MSVDELFGLHDEDERAAIRRGVKVRTEMWWMVGVLLLGVAAVIACMLASLLEPLLIVSLLGVVLMYFVDRSRRRRALAEELRFYHRCAHCGYSLRGIASGQCPECGAERETLAS